jgi:hypothetical protein
MKKHKTIGFERVVKSEGYSIPHIININKIELFILFLNINNNVYYNYRHTS